MTTTTPQMSLWSDITTQDPKEQRRKQARQAHTINAKLEAIKAEGFRWAHEKEAWYFAGVPSFNRQKRTLDEIRNMHGSQRFTRNARQPMYEDSELLTA